MTPVVDSYLSRAGDSLDAAELLLSGGFHEIAVSRAYYAMFYVAEAFLASRELAYAKHSGVIATFGREFAKTGIVPVHFHRYLIRGQELRLLADYRGTPLTDEEARIQIDRGREFLAFAVQFFSG